MRIKLFFVLFFILIFVSYLNIKENHLKEEAVMPEKEIKKVHATDAEPIAEELPPSLFPDVYDLSTLTVNPRLPLPNFVKLADTVQIHDSIISLEVKLPESVSAADLFLFRNGKKIDMYYQVDGGIYRFKKIQLDKGENLLETFYRKGSKKSISVYTIIKLIQRE